MSGCPTRDVGRDIGERVAAAGRRVVNDLSYVGRRCRGECGGPLQPLAGVRNDRVIVAIAATAASSRLRVEKIVLNEPPGIRRHERAKWGWISFVSQDSSAAAAKT